MFSCFAELELDGNKVVTVEGQYRRSNGKEYHTPKGKESLGCRQEGTVKRRNLLMVLPV